MTAEDDVSFGELLRHYRLAAYLTQEVLAERARLSVRAISDLERGIKRTPHNDTLELLATALALPAQECAAFKAAARRRGDQAPPISVRALGAAAEDSAPAAVPPDVLGVPFIFVACAPADAAGARQLSAALAARGITCWVDSQDLKPGSLTWEQELRDAIRAAQAVVLVASPNVPQSRHVPDELRIAEM